jgi:hypothetical protein
VTPNQIADSLRRIAASLDNSERPDVNLVTKNLREVLAAVPVEDAYALSGKAADAALKVLQSEGVDLSLNDQNKLESIFAEFIQTVGD